MPRQFAMHLIISLVAHPGLPGLRRGPTPKEGAPTLLLWHFSKKMNKLKIIGPLGGEWMSLVLAQSPKGASS